MESSLDQLSAPPANSGQAAGPSEHRALESRWRWCGSKSNFWLTVVAATVAVGCWNRARPGPPSAAAVLTSKMNFEVI